ncbi:HAD family hydrolase [Clostridium algidicarnis]|uniref:HAD family hydrolase n=1 Tax=Clostridium algidicarnis TaxID=37659 RepID=A0ABS6C462_9CLOT|nr:HAD family hydrolase [Clostridium algidicarnis]MBU3220275.1 HAD family hydrolase [Clostridium algidicarnis]
MKLDSIIFDLDGTLWDSTAEVVRSFNKTLSKYSEVKEKLTIDDIKGIMGFTIEDISLKFFPYLSKEKGLEIIKKCCEEECGYLENRGGILYPRVEENLKKLATTHKLFIVSSCQCGYIEAFFKAHGLSKYFIDYENPGRTGLLKGENINLIIDRNNLKSPIYVGDTKGDLKASRFASIPFIYARYGFGEVTGYDYVIDRFEEVYEIVMS